MGPFHYSLKTTRLTGRTQANGTQQDLTDMQDKNSTAANLVREIRNELEGNIIPFWKSKVLDEKNGGFIGEMTSDGTVLADADKGLILNARNLWSYACCCRHLNDATLKPLADRAYQYIEDHFLDKDYGGAYWMLDAKGTPIDTSKKCYGQAFLIYGWVEYFRITRKPGVLAQAMQLYRILEAQVKDPVHGGYPEAFDRDWSLNDALRLSDKDMNEKKSMNNHLHVLEAYTQLFIETRDPDVGRSIADLLGIFRDHIIDRDRGHLKLFFSDDWRCKSELDSYGHDIEATWLQCEAAEALGDREWISLMQQIALEMTDVCLLEGFDSDGAVFHEGWKCHIHDRDKHWWPQAEAIVGLVNAWQISGKQRYLDAAEKTWSFIRDHIVDRNNGEWHWKVDGDRRLCPQDPKVSAWKSFYHNSRFCIETIHRLANQQAFL